MRANVVIGAINLKQAKARAKRHLLNYPLARVTVEIKRHGGKPRVTTSANANENADLLSGLSTPEPAEEFVGRVDAVIECAVQKALAEFESDLFGSVAVEIERAGTKVAHVETSIKDHYLNADRPRRYVVRHSGARDNVGSKS